LKKLTKNQSLCGFAAVLALPSRFARSPAGAVGEADGGRESNNEVSLPPPLRGTSPVRYRLYIDLPRRFCARSSDVISIGKYIRLPQSGRLWYNYGKCFSAGVPMLQTILATLFGVIVPIAIPVVAGMLLVRYKKLDTKPILTLVLYFLMPCMVFNTLYHAEVSITDLVHTALFCLANLLLLWGVAVLTGKVFRLSAPQTAGLTLISTLTNSVNYGLPLVLLAFGQAGLEKASLYVVIQMILVNTVGVFFAARSNFSIKNAVKSVFTLPSIYAAILAGLLRLFPLELPEVLGTGVDMVAKAYSPVVLVVLGAQMAWAKNTVLERDARAAFWSGMTIRMLLAPVIAALVLFLLGVDGVLFSTLFILASMPVAVNSVILAEKFDASPAIVSKCILWTTLGSFITLPILIEVVKRLV